MTVPLMILAALATVGGWIGWPESLGGSDRFAKFLEPVMAKHAEEAGEAAGASRFRRIDGIFADAALRADGLRRHLAGI